MEGWFESSVMVGLRILLRTTRIHNRLEKNNNKKERKVGGRKEIIIIMER